MAQKNTKVVRKPIKTFEGGHASRIQAIEQLKRSVLSTMLWENSFYEDGEAIAERIIRLTQEVKEAAIPIMLDAKYKQKIRHAPLLMGVALARIGLLSAENLSALIRRADELAEFLSLSIG